MNTDFEVIKNNQSIYEDCELADKMISGTTRVEILTALRSYGSAFEKMVNVLILKAGITQEQILKIKKQNGKDGIADLYGKIMALKATGFVSVDSGNNYEKLRKFRNSAVHESENAGGKCYQTIGIKELRDEAMNMRTIMLVEAERFGNVYMQKDAVANVRLMRNTGKIVNYGKKSGSAGRVMAVFKFAAACIAIIMIWGYLSDNQLVDDIWSAEPAGTAYSQSLTAGKATTAANKKRVKKADSENHVTEQTQTTQGNLSDQEQAEQIQSQINDVEAQLAQARTDYMNSRPGSQKGNALFDEIGKLGQKRVDLYGQLYQIQFRINSQ